MYVACHQRPPGEQELRQTNAVLQQDKVKLNDALESIIEESGLEAEQLEQLKSKQRAASTDQETAKDELVRLRKTADEAERHVNTLTAQLETAQEERDDFKKKLDGLDASAMQVCLTLYFLSGYHVQYVAQRVRCRSVVADLLWHRLLSAPCGVPWSREPFAPHSLTVACGRTSPPTTQSKLEDLYGELADTTERSAAQVEDLEGQNQELQEAYDELERKSKGLRSTLMSRFSEAQAKAKEEESVLRDQLDELQMEITELRSGDNGGGLGGSDSLASELNPAPRPSPGKSKELEDKLRAQDEDIASLGDSNRKLQDELVAATSKTQEAELGLAAVTEKVSAAEEALTKSQTSLDEERAKSKALQSELLAAKELSIGNADALDSKLVAKDDEVKQAQRQLAESEAALAKATTTMTKKVEALEEAKADAKAQLEESKVALSAMKAENQASIRDLTKSSREAEASLQVAKNSLEIAQKTLSDTEQLLQEAHVKASSMEAAADKLRLEVRTLTESEEKFQSQAMSQSSSQSEKAAQIATLKDENARLDALRKKADVQLEEHLDAHAKRLGSWNDKEAELHVSLKAKSDEILELKTKLQEAEGSKDVAEAGAAEVMKLKDALAKEKDEAHRLHEQLQQEKDRSAEHLTALREMRDEKDGAISEKEQIQLIVNSLEHETGRLKAQLSQMAEGSGKTEEDAVAKQREMDEELAALFEEMERNEQVAKETERALGNEICDREEELVEVKAELEDLQSERDRFTAHHQEIQDAMEGIAKEDAVLQEELNAVKRDNLILGADVSSTREALESKAAEVLRLEKVCDASDAQIAKINQQLSGAETAKGDAERKAASMTQRFDALLAEFRVLETTASESKEKHAAEVVELNAIVSGLKADKDRKHAELLSGTRSLSEIRLRAEQLEHQVDTLKIEIEDAQIKAEEMEDEHEDELAQLNEELEMSKAEAEAVAETCQEEIDEIADREEKLQFEKQMLEDRQAQLEAKLANLAAITSQERTASLTRTQALETTADELTTQKENLLRELKAASANVVRLEDFLKSTTAAYEKFKAGVSDREAKLADQLNFKAEELEEVTAEKDSLLDEVNDLMVLTSELHDDVTAEKERREQHQLEVEQQQLEYDRQIDALKFEKEEAAEQIQEHGGSKKELARLAHSLEKLQKEHAALVEENHTVEEENMSMQEEINDLLSITQELRDENDELKELGALSPDGASGEVQGLAGLTGITSESLAEQRSDELEAEVKALKTELNQQKVRMREKELAVKRANLKWKEEVEQSKSEYDAASSDLIKELEEYRDEINELLQVNTDLRNDIEVLKEGCGAGAGTDSGGSGGGQNDSLLGNSAENALAKMNLDDLCSQLEKFRQAVLEKDVRVKELEIETSGLSRKNGELDHKLAASIEEQNTLMGFMTEVNEELKELKQNRGGNLDALAAQTTLLGSSAVLEGMSGVQTAFINSELEVALEDAKAKDVEIEALGMAQKDLQHDVDELQKDVKAKLIQVQQVEAELDELTSENDELLELVRTTNEVRHGLGYRRGVRSCVIPLLFAGGG